MHLPEQRKGPPEWLAKPGAWFWLLCTAGLFLRLYLASATRGTADADLWTEHAAGVNADGLIGHYERNVLFNHPPFAGYLMAKLWQLADYWRIEFRVLYRSIFSMVDLVNVWLLLRVLESHRWRYLLAGLYAVAPVALVLSAMHGNTDALVSTCLLLTCLATGARRPLLAGVSIGIGAWIKVPALLAAPAFGFAFPAWRDRVYCAGVAVAVAALTYLPAFAVNPTLLSSRIFGYRGMFVAVSSDPPTWIWGFQIWITRLFAANVADWPPTYVWFREHSFWVAIPILSLYGFLRRRGNDAASLAATVAGTYAIFYAFTEQWTFQYFAWSMPFWLLAGRTFAVAANVFGGGYIYALYAYLCGDWLLRPVWTIQAHPNWPVPMILLRDLAHATFVTFAIHFLASAVVAEWRLRSAPKAAVKRSGHRRPKSR